MPVIDQCLPADAHARLQANEHAKLIDVRDPVEYAFVGHPVGAVNVPWKFRPDMRVNDAFVEQVRRVAPNPETPLYLLCRSGQRSMAAAQALADAGYTHLINIEEGFEGPLDANQHRGTLGGWQFHGLPWVQS